MARQGGSSGMVAAIAETDKQACVCGPFVCACVRINRGLGCNDAHGPQTLSVAIRKAKQNKIDFVFRVLSGKIGKGIKWLSIPRLTISSTFTNEYCARRFPERMAGELIGIPSLGKSEYRY